MDNVMVDLETLGRRPGCAILSIGAIAFDPHSGKLGPGFYAVVSRAHQASLGCLHEDPETLKWWQGQHEAARRVLDDAEKETALPLNEVLHQFTGFLDIFDLKRVKVWGNGSDFDNAILACCYDAIGAEVPWQFWNNRCYRTLKSLVPGPKIERRGVHHDAFDDAKSQALHAIQLLR